MTEKLATKRNPPKWSLWLRGLDEWLLIFQKVSGAILAIYLIGHTLVISTALGFGHPSQLTWERVIGLIEGPRVVGVAHVGTIIEYLIALLVAVHGANGVRLILMQFVRKRKVASARTAERRLRELAQQGLLRRKPLGRTTVFWLTAKACDEFKAWLERYRGTEEYKELVAHATQYNRSP